jgi:hypothetical protein
MKGTDWRRVLRRVAADVHRELRVTLTPAPRPEKWVFLVGCYNSGTQLGMHVLGSHPDISALPEEGQFLTDQFTPDFQLGLPRMWVLREDLFRLTEADEGPDTARLKKEWGARLDLSKPILLEKSPPNAARTRWLQRHFENAHFLAFVRNGYAVAEGIRRKAMPKHRRGGWPLELCARQWARCNEVLLEDAEYLERVLWVRYEDLTDRPGAEIGRILRFLGIPEPTGIDLKSSWSVHEREEPIRNMNQESFDRLSSEDIASITGEARPMLERFGYPLL